MAELHLVHPTTGLMAIGVRRDGRPIWPVVGASDPPADPPTTDPTPPVDQPPTDPAGDPSADPGDTDLPEGAKRALAAARREARDATKALKEAQATIKGYEDRDKTEQEKAADRATAAEQRAASLLDRAVRAEVRALAASDFADPADAALYLDLAKYADDAGEINADAIATDLADLLARKPHLAKAPGKTGPKPDPSQGSKSPVGVDDQIAAAKKNGNWTQVISLENQKLTFN